MSQDVRVYRLAAVTPGLPTDTRFELNQGCRGLLCEELKDKLLTEGDPVSLRAHLSRPFAVSLRDAPIYRYLVPHQEVLQETIVPGGDQFSLQPGDPP